MNENENPENSGVVKLNPDSKGRLAYMPHILAIGILIAYGFFIYFLIGNVGAEDLDWSRLIYLFSGVEAIVFAATGFLFGREVNRKRAENAETEKKLAEKQKEEAKAQGVEDRKNGLILGAMAIQAERTLTQSSDKSAALEGMGPKQNTLGNLAESARKMYPELQEK